jgi:hypothetical protein
MMAVTFWELPIGVDVQAPDEALSSLEALAALAAPSGWGVELRSEGAHFRFAERNEALAFVLACRHPAGICDG